MNALQYTKFYGMAAITQVSMLKTQSYSYQFLRGNDSFINLQRANCLLELKEKRSTENSMGCYLSV